ncbi:MAG: hypothetical protein QOK27_2764 [Gemmatimonadales bacterium]|nr:hypothetical protein [Gemmatimonadales bacterium]
MSIRAPAVLLAALVTVAGACGGDAPTDPGAQPPPAVASVRIIAGAGQTDTAGAALSTPVVIEVLDVNGHGSPGRSIVLAEAGSEPPLNYQSGDPSGHVVTDSAGRAEVIWRVYGLTGTRHLIVGVLGSASVGKDTITATVLPAGPWEVHYVETEIQRLLDEPADLAANIVSVTDSWGNPVAVQTLSVDAPTPLLVSGGTTVQSHEETDTVVTLRINGVAFLQRVVVLRSIQEFIGAVGDWTCSSAPGAPWEDVPGTGWAGRYLQTQTGHFVVDSVTRYGDYGAQWTLHLSTTLHQTFDDGEIRTVGPFYEQRYVLLQFPQGFLFPYGPQMHQTSADPITYAESGANGCVAWNGPSNHVPLTITLTPR